MAESIVMRVDLTKCSDELLRNIYHVANDRAFRHEAFKGHVGGEYEVAMSDIEEARAEMSRRGMD